MEQLSLAEMEDFLTGSKQLEDQVARDESYGLIEGVLNAQHYRKLGKGERGPVSRFLRKVTGLSRAQVNRLIARGRRTGHVVREPTKSRPSFPRLYPAADVARLAETDAAHEDLSGPAVRRLFLRSHEVFGDLRYRRLASEGATYASQKAFSQGLCP